MPDQTPGDRVLAVRRTLAPQAIAGLVLILGEWGIDMSWLTDRPATLTVAHFLLAAVIYLTAVVLGRRWPWIEAVLLTSSSKPHYGGKA